MPSEIALYGSEDSGIPPSSHLESEGARAALRNGDVVSLIVDALPVPESPAASVLESPQSKAARADLYHLACAAAIFFYPTTKKLWESLHTLKHLLQLLVHTEEPHIGHNTGSPGGRRLYSITPETCKDHPAYRHFCYYGSCIKYLRVDMKDIPVRALVHLQHLTSPSSSHFLPALRSLVWEEPNPCAILRIDITPFLRSAQLVSVSLYVENKNHEFATQEHKVSCRNALLQLLRTVSSTSPCLERLTIQFPPSIPLPALLFRGFDRVLRANLRMCVGASSSSDTGLSLDRPQLSTLERLDLCWTTESSAQEVVNNLALRKVCHLGINSNDSALGAPFLGDVRILAASTSVHLTTIEIISIAPLRAPAVSGGDFMTLIRPFLPRSHLRHVAIILPKFSFSFGPSQLESLVQAWPKLEVLHLSFVLQSYNMLPNVQHILPMITQQCPDLAFVHLPAMATVRGHGLFSLPARPSSNLRHLSSDLMAIQHGPLDVAVSLATAFPKLAQLGPPGGSSDWQELHSLVNAFRNFNYPVLFERILQYMHDGVYATNRLPELVHSAAAPGTRSRGFAKLASERRPRGAQTLPGGATGSGQRASANGNRSRRDMPRTDLVAPSARYLLAEAWARCGAPVGRDSAVQRFARPVAWPGKQLRASGTPGRSYRVRVYREHIPSNLGELRGESAAPTRTPARRACSPEDDCEPVARPARLYGRLKRRPGETRDACHECPGRRAARTAHKVSPSAFWWSSRHLDTSAGDEARRRESPPGRPCSIRHYSRYDAAHGTPRST
ncbi:hypothetical protein VTO73DRAFT_3603 [Trametes versicolor]